MVQMKLTSGAPETKVPSYICKVIVPVNSCLSSNEAGTSRVKKVCPFTNNFDEVLFPM